MSDQDGYMGDEHYSDSIGGPQDYAAYRKEFEAFEGMPFPFARDPRASYEVDYACELAYERYMEESEWGPPSAPSDLTAGHDDVEPDFEAG